MGRVLFQTIFIFVFIFCFTAPAAPAERREYDVVVAGGGIGGIAAAIQAARMGVSVLVVEPSDWIGGQATAAGVSTMDDLSRQSSGLYLEFISRLRNYYDSRRKSMGTCYWDSRSVAFEPSVGQRALQTMLSTARASGKKALDIRLLSDVTQVTREGNVVTEVAVFDKQTGTSRKIKCHVLIDATEYGDVLPLAKAEYRAGNSATPFLDQDAMIQDITWPAIIRHYPGGIPPHLQVRRPLPGYEEARRNYESYVTADGQNFKGVYPVQLPVNFVSHNAYRGLPDSLTSWSYDGQPQNWKYITKSAVNWGNDYPGKDSWNGRSGLPVRYLEDRGLRARVEKDAFIKTLHFIYYIQNELGESWSVADDEYLHNTPPAAGRELPPDWLEVARRMPPIPYVRESRRAVGDYVLTSSELLRNSLSYRDGQTSHEFGDAIAIGGYILDLHGANTDSDMEWEMGEKASSSSINRPRGPFQVPLRILIPKNTDGLLVAEKNLSMSRLAAGALRLQPICMMVGQAAGALAALSVKAGVPPREVPPVKVQRALLDAGVALSLCKYSDVPPEHPFYGAVQLSNLYGLLPPVEPPHAPSYNISDLNDPVLAMAIIKGADKGIFGVDALLSREEMVSMVNKARAVSKIAGGRDLTEDEWPDATSFVSRGMFSDAIFRAFGLEARKLPKKRPYFDIPSTHRFAEPVQALDAFDLLNVFRTERDFRPARPLSRGEAADILMRTMSADM
jgi:hypothetical protein